MTSSFKYFSADEVENGLRYAKEELKVTLDRDMLRTLANMIGERWVKQGRIPRTLHTIKQGILLERIKQRDRNETDRRNAYSSAISKMFSIRAHQSKKSSKRARTDAHKDPRSESPPSVDRYGQLQLPFSRV